MASELNITAMLLMLVAGGWQCRLALPDKVPRRLDALPAMILVLVGGAWVAATLLHLISLRLFWMTGAITALVLQTLVGPAMVVGGGLGLTAALRAGPASRTSRLAGHLAAVALLAGLWLGWYAFRFPNVFRIVGVAPLVG